MRRMCALALGLALAVTMLARGTAQPIGALSAAAAANVTLWAAGNSTVISADTADLSAISWDNRATAIKPENVWAVAVYADKNYQGTCETLFGRGWRTLSGSTIGENTISSLKVNATCSGPTNGAPVVTDVKFINSSDDSNRNCGSGYTRKWLDLNYEAGGDFIYACVWYAPANNSTYITAAHPYNNGLTPASSVFACRSSDNMIFLDLDLNKGAGGSYIYMCLWTNATTYQNNDRNRPLRDLDFAYFDSVPSSASLTSSCASTMFVPESAVATDNEDLNASAGGKYIYTCMSYFGGDPVNADTTPPTITYTGAKTADDAAYTLGGWTNQSVTLTWSCTDADSGVVAATVTQTLSAEGGGQAATGTCADQAGNSLGDTRAGINIDRTAPETSFSTAPNAAPGGTYITRPVAVTLAGSDGLAGIAGTFYTLDGGATQSYGAPLSLTADGAHTITYWSTDRAGNVGTPLTQTVVIVTNTITFPAPVTPQVYGAEPLTLAATASSGLTVAYDTTGPCHASGAQLFIDGAGSCVVTAQQGGDASHNAATPVSRTVVISRAALAVRAQDQSRPYGDAAPLACPISYSGFVGADGTGSLTGAPACATVATASSSPGTYPITVAQGTLNSANYTFSFAGGTLTITQAATRFAEVRGALTYGDATGSVTATLRRVGGDNGPVAGATIRFTIKGAALCGGAGQPPCPTTNAQGVATMSGLPFPDKRNAGSYANVVGVSYAGDSNHLGSQGSGPLTVTRRILLVKPVDQTVKLRQPNPTGCTLELAPGSAFVNGDGWSAINLANLRCATSRNYPGSNAAETVGKTYKISATGVASANYDLRFQQGTLTVVP